MLFILILLLTAERAEEIKPSENIPNQITQKELEVLLIEFSRVQEENSKRRAEEFRRKLQSLISEKAGTISKESGFTEWLTNQLALWKGTAENDLKREVDSLSNSFNTQLTQLQSTVEQNIKASYRQSTVQTLPDTSQKELQEEQGLQSSILDDEKELARIAKKGNMFFVWTTFLSIQVLLIFAILNHKNVVKRERGTLI
ncbi:MAG: hypothetical protein EZS28_005566 [Streblomastix strix]|uniref:GOLD domain-containing protein n=1 Tax=Streblomastix strix TaxID=222440 RepID=A0A5J4WV98_9EUKA|nr:MAG: hypothetical protein EZS28_005566 [Streblomastix strix]